MIIQSSRPGSPSLAPAPAPALAPPLPALRRDAHSTDTLVIGVLALRPKDATVLRALIRVLDGSLGMSLRFSDTPAECHVLFVTPSAAARCTGCATILVSESGLEPTAPGRPITVASPLRMGAVVAALQLMLSRLRPTASAERALWLSALFERLQQGLKVGGYSTLPFGSGHLLQLDAASQSLRSSLSAERLLAQPHRAGALRPSTAVDDEMLHGAAPHALRSWLWRLSAHMLSAKAAHPALRGSWLLLQWPPAAGLMAPGHPHLAALLMRRPYSDQELAQRTQLPLPSVQAFMLTCDALGLLGQPSGAVCDAGPFGPGHGAHPPRWLHQVRANLRLW